jgi:hypothetical protein
LRAALIGFEEKCNAKATSTAGPKRKKAAKKKRRPAARAGT